MEQHDKGGQAKEDPKAITVLIQQLEIVVKGAKENSDFLYEKLQNYQVLVLLVIRRNPKYKMKQTDILVD